MPKLALRALVTCHVACGGALRRWVRWRTGYIDIPICLHAYMPTRLHSSQVPLTTRNSTPITTLTMSFVESCPYHTFTCSYQMSKCPARCVAKIRAVQVENGRVVRENATLIPILSSSLPHSFTLSLLCTCALTIICLSRV